MGETTRLPVSDGFGRVVTEFYRWLPATVALLLYVAGGNMIYFTFAIALILGAAVSAVHQA